MMKTFIALTDFSQNAAHASSYAVQLAGQLNARLILMHAFEAPVAVSEYELTTIHFHSMEERIRKQLEDRKQELINEYGSRVPIECRIFNNDLIGHVKKLFEETEAQLGIIGLTGAGMVNFFLGSNTLNIVNNTSHIILTVPPYASFRPIRKVIFACDMTEGTTTIPAERIKIIINVLDAQLLILNIKHPNDKNEADVEEAQQMLKQMFEGVRFTFHSVHSKNVVAGIKDFAKEKQADLIAIIPKKHGFIEQLLKTNHTKAMLFRSGIPILTIPGKII